MTEGGSTQNVGQQPAEQIPHAPEAFGPHKGSHRSGLLFIGCGQLAEHFLLPLLLDQGLQLRRKRWYGIMR